MGRPGLVVGCCLSRREGRRADPRPSAFRARRALGAINGLLPCGLVYAAVAGAAASGSVATAVTFMAGFGAGTVPLLLAVTLSAASIPATLRQRLRFVAPALMALAGVLLIARAFMPAEGPQHQHQMSAMSGAHGGDGEHGGN